MFQKKMYLPDVLVEFDYAIEFEHGIRKGSAELPGEKKWEVQVRIL